ncbi:MAG: hypothetical protein RQ729_12755 [Wenzhouxiangellaceae bacterium]|nr:hypothetical protein [Wenzhouxiangellaceae bacterium]
MKIHRIALTVLLLTAALSAQSQSPHSAQTQANILIQQVQQLQQQIQEINRELAAIQQQAMAQNPELASQRDELMDLVDTKMADAGFDADASRDRLDSLRERIESDAATDEETTQLARQFREQQTRLQQAQSEAMQDEAVQSQLQSLNENLVVAMREQNAETDQLIDDLQQAREQYQSLMRQAMQNHGGASQPQ